MTGSAQTPTPTTPEQTPAPTPATEPAAAPQPAAPAAEPSPASAEPAPQTAAPAGSTVNAHKYQRDIARLEAEREAAKVENDLKAAGCHDVVAATARLKEFDGDVSKLKETAPYLFTSSDKSKSTGGNPKGTPDPEDERTKKMRETFGLTNE